MDKLKMQSENIVDENVEFLKQKFPNCIVEGRNENGELIKSVDFDLLKQELSKVVVEGNDERYVMNWPGKKESILLANSPISATLRPCTEESVGKDGTSGGFDSENLYIEGDNLDVLKLLRETYLNKVKMIYIDPPYNTGNDFVYNDDFKQSAEEYLEESGAYDEQGNRMLQNNDSNGRFHSDWLSMMYSRLKLAKDLLTEDGVIFISIDDNEQSNLKKICDEIFGESNFVACLAIENNPKGRKNGKYFSINHENCIIFAKNYTAGNGFCNVIAKEGMKKDKNGYYSPGQRVLVGKCSNKIVENNKSDKYYKVYYKENFPLEIRKVVDNKLTDYKLYQSLNEQGQIIENTYTIDKILALYNNDDLVFNENTIYEKDRNINKQQKTLINSTTQYDLKTESANFVAGDFDLKKIFSMPKNISYIKMLLKLKLTPNDIILDFFSGSATTAHAVMQLNAEDGGNRKFICVQLPEKTDEKSEAFKAGYNNICEIGKERIRRAGKKIREFLLESGYNHRNFINDGRPSGISKMHDVPHNIQKLNKEIADSVDIGFRCLKLDSSNMKDVYCKPEYTKQFDIDDLADNIKDKRTAEDLLFQVMLDMGVMLSSTIEEKKCIIANGECQIIDKADSQSTATDSQLSIFIVGEYTPGDAEDRPNLICCFDKNLTEEVITAIAKMKPLYAVFRDSSISSDSISVNFDQIFATYRPTTARRVL